MAVRHCYLAAAKCSDPPDCANCFEMGYITYHYGDLGRDCRLFLSSLLGASRSRHPINSKPLNVAQRASSNSSQVRRSDNIYPDFIVADGTGSFPKNQDFSSYTHARDVTIPRWRSSKLFFASKCLLTWTLSFMSLQSKRTDLAWKGLRQLSERATIGLCRESLPPHWESEVVYKVK